MKEDLEKLEKFFKYNLVIKEKLYNCAPNESYRYNEEAMIQYSDRLYDTLDEIRYYMMNVIKDYMSDESVSYFNRFFNTLRTELINCGTDYNKLKHFYTTRMSDMSVELVDETRKEIVGYYMMSSGMGLARKAKTINELLHVMHCAIINNEGTYSSIPVVESREFKEGHDLHYRGVMSPEGKVIFDSIPNDVDSYLVDFVAFDKKVIIMARDLGHALTVEVDFEGKDKCMVRYFIPKVCNYVMVNQLKGVTKVEFGAPYAVGSFESDLTQIMSDLPTFLRGVPTDEHMFIPGGSIYRQNQGEAIKIYESLRAK